MIVLPTPVRAQPSVSGFPERIELQQREITTLHIHLQNNSKEPIQISRIRVISGGLTAVDGASLAAVRLEPYQSLTLPVTLRADSVGETTVGVEIFWFFSGDKGTLLTPLGKVRVIEPSWYGLARGVFFAALLGFLGNLYLSRKKNEWDKKATDSAQKHEIIRRMAEKVHTLVQTYYEKIASWAYSFDLTATDVLNGKSQFDERAQYLCYLLSTLMHIETDMEDTVGGYFLADRAAEEVLTYLENDVVDVLTDSSLFTDEDYSEFIGVLGARRLFKEFHLLLQDDEEARSVFEQFKRCVSDSARMNSLRRFLRLKWKLLELHIRLTYKDWYPRRIPPPFDDEDFEVLHGVIQQIIDERDLPADVAEEYERSVKESASKLSA